MVPEASALKIKYKVRRGTSAEYDMHTPNAAYCTNEGLTVQFVVEYCLNRTT
jgi:hypothetical protein